MVNSGLSPSTVGWLGYSPDRAPCFGMPPVHAGMTPSLLPAFSAPIGVRSLPRWDASSGDTLAAACWADKPRTAAQRNQNAFFMRMLSSQGYGGCRRSPASDGPPMLPKKPQPRQGSLRACEEMHVL